MVSGQLLFDFLLERAGWCNCDCLMSLGVSNCRAVLQASLHPWLLSHSTWQRCEFWEQQLQERAVWWEADETIGIRDVNACVRVSCEDQCGVAN